MQVCEEKKKNCSTVEILVIKISVDSVLHLLSSVKTLLSRAGNSTFLGLTHFDFHPPAAVTIVI